MTQLGLEPARFEVDGAEPPATFDLTTVADGPPIAEPAGEGATALALDQASDNFGQRLCPLDLQELFALDIKPRGMVLDPIIPEKGLVMLYATRGTGKTHVALGIAYAVATGSTFLKWRAETPRRVLLIDGEMPASALRERLQRVASAEEGAHGPATLKIIAGDLID